MRAFLLACILASPVAAQTGPLGLFAGSTDIGAPPLKGGSQFDQATGEYRVTGTGSDIWGTSDQFHYLWREISGDFAATATARFLTDGDPHRKASIMLRKSTDADSPFLHFAIHGDGMASVQFRTARGNATNTLDFPTSGTGTYTLRLIRQGGNVRVLIAQAGFPLRELGHTVNQLGSPVLVGLAVASHNQAALNTVLFSDVSIESSLAPAGALPR
jgi:TolB protein